MARRIARGRGPCARLARPGPGGDDVVNGPEARSARMAHEVEHAEVLSDYQNEIYASGEAPPYPMRWRDLEAAALEALSAESADYLAGGAGGEDTVRANREAFDRWRIVPRMLR